MASGEGISLALGDQAFARHRPGMSRRRPTIGRRTKGAGAGLSKVRIVAHSSGAHAALFFAALHPEMMAGETS